MAKKKESGWSDLYTKRGLDSSLAGIPYYCPDDLLNQSI